MEHLDVLEQISSSLLPRSVASPVHTFTFEDPEEAFDIARCTVVRLMKDIGIEGVVRGMKSKTTTPDKALPCPLDKVNRQFHAPAPNVHWVSDFTYVATWQGFVYVAFVIDVFALRIVGWRVNRTATAGFVFDALEQAVQQRRPGSGQTHHSDCGSQYLSFRHTERLTEAGIEPSVGSVGDSYDNTLAETINGLFKAEAIHRRGPWRSFDAVEYATLEWVDGSTIADCWNPSGVSRQQKQRQSSTRLWKDQKWPRN